MTRVPPENRSAGLRCYHRRALEFRVLGLTCKGKPYRRTPNYKIRAERRDAVNARNLLWITRRNVSRIVDGLTTRGGQRVLRLKYFDSFILASEIDAAVKSLDAFFKELPTPAQAACLQLANHLAALRRRLPKE